MSNPQQDHRSSALSFLKNSLELLQTSLSDQGRREARFVSLATLVGGEGSERHPAVRTVVMRQWESSPPLWRFHTDRRAAKAGEFAQNERVSAVFWDTVNQLQIRLDGIAGECGDAACIAETWHSLGDRAQQSFSRLEAPGEALDRPDALSFEKPSASESLTKGQLVSSNFMLVEVRVTSIDCLSLADDPHHRVKGEWVEGQWMARWVGP